MAPDRSVCRVSSIHSPAREGPSEHRQGLLRACWPDSSGP
jgi:hypothetical protein